MNNLSIQLDVMKNQLFKVYVEQENHDFTTRQTQTIVLISFMVGVVQAVIFSILEKIVKNFARNKIVNI